MSPSMGNRVKRQCLWRQIWQWDASHQLLLSFVIFACTEFLHHSALTQQDRWNKRQEAAVPSDSQLRMALMTKDNSRQKNVHTVERSWAIIHRGLEARNKCPYVIDYTLQANEINRAWIHSDESCQRDVRSRVQWLYWHAHIQRASERDQSALLVGNKAVSFFTTRICFTHHCNQGQHCSNQMQAIGSDKLETYCWDITAEKTFLLSKTNNIQAARQEILLWRHTEQLWFQMKEI